MSKPSKKDAPWRFDWAGRHGTAWGTANACLTTLTATTAAHAVGSLPEWLGGPIDIPPVAALGVGAFGVVASFGKAALASVKTPVATVVYQAACWSGIGTWSAWMLSQQDWTLSSWLVGTGVLSGAAIAAGIVAGLGSQGGEEGDEDSPDVQRSLVARKKDWEARILRLGGVEAIVKIKRIEDWEKGNGYSLQGTFQDARFGLDRLKGLCAVLAQDLNLREGCAIEVYRPAGGRRRDWVMDISTVNYLAETKEYPLDIRPRTINEPFPIGLRANGEVETLSVRSRNVLVVGEPEAGKTNLHHVKTAGYVSCVDAIPVQIDLTGAGLSRPWTRAWEEGEADRPALGCVGDTEEKAEALCRALLRGGYARKEHYQDLMAQHDDDKIPIGAVVVDDDGQEYVIPQLMLSVDEIAKIVGRNTLYPELKARIKEIMQELRASGIRVDLAGLRSTDDVITQDMEALCQSIVAMKMKTDGELANTLGRNCGITVEDFPAPGYGACRQSSGDQALRFRTYRMTPSLIRKISIMATDPENGWAPDLDPITRMAMNGRHPNGAPMALGPYMKQGDLDFWDRRWDGWTAKKETAATALPAAPALPPPPVIPSRGASTELLERPMVEVTEDDTCEDEASEILRKVDWSIAENWGIKPVTWSDRVKTLLENAWPAGISPDELLEDADVTVSRGHLQAWLKREVEAGAIAKVARGKYAIPPGGEMAA